LLENGGPITEQPSSRGWCKGKQSLADVLIGESWCIVSREREIGEWGLRVETFKSLERLFSFGSNGGSDEHLQGFTNVTNPQSAKNSLLEVMARTSTGRRFRRLSKPRKHTLPKDRFLIGPGHKTGVNKIGSRLHPRNSFPTANGSQQDTLRKTGIIKPSLRGATIQGIFQQGSPGASKQGCLSAGYVLHERDIGKAQTEKLSIQGSPG